MSIDKIATGLGGFAPISKPNPIIGNGQPQAAEGASFSEVFSNAIKEVDSLQKEADQQIENVALGKEGATTHGAMIALEKADVAFQLMNSIRAKIVRAYEDVMRTQV